MNRTFRIKLWRVQEVFEGTWDMVTVGSVRWHRASGNGVANVTMLSVPVSRLACFDSGMIAKIRLLLPTDLSCPRNVWVIGNGRGIRLIGKFIRSVGSSIFYITLLQRVKCWSILEIVDTIGRISVKFSAIVYERLYLCQWQLLWRFIRRPCIYLLSNQPVIQN